MTKTLMIIYYVSGSAYSPAMTSQIVTQNECQLVAKLASADDWKVYCYPMEVSK